MKCTIYKVKIIITKRLRRYYQKNSAFHILFHSAFLVLQVYTSYIFNILPQVMISLTYLSKLFHPISSRLVSSTVSYEPRVAR